MVCTRCTKWVYLIPFIKAVMKIIFMCEHIFVSMFIYTYIFRFLSQCTHTYLLLVWGGMTVHMCVCKHYKMCSWQNLKMYLWHYLYCHRCSEPSGLLLSSMALRNWGWIHLIPYLENTQAHVKEKRFGESNTGLQLLTGVNITHIYFIE